jgi:hypothetical protein
MIKTFWEFINLGFDWELEIGIWDFVHLILKIDYFQLKWYNILIIALVVKWISLLPSPSDEHWACQVD